MTEDECRDIVRALMRKGEVSCSDLYRELGGYDIHGGRYDTAQKFLGDMGWVYHIGIDAWRPGILTPAIEWLVELFNEANVCDEYEYEDDSDPHDDSVTSEESRARAAASFDRMRRLLADSAQASEAAGQMRAERGLRASTLAWEADALARHAVEGTAT